MSELKVKPNKSNLKGRLPGVKNKTTIFKEAMLQGWEKALEKDAMAVFRATVQCALGQPSKDDKGNLLKDAKGNQLYLDGDTSCKKMILDRVVPASKAIDINANDLKSGMGITINIDQLVATSREPATIEAEDAEFRVQEEDNVKE